MPASYWKVLGIEPTPSEADIRRAYAIKLRVTNPEDDAAGFQKLREAYEQALAHARYMQAYPDTGEEDDDAGADDEQLDDAEGDGASDKAYDPGTPLGIGEDAAATDATPDPLELERRDHDARCRRLIELLQVKSPPDEREEAQRDILSSPAMQQIDVYTATEHWIAHVLVSSRPASAPLFEDAIAFFRWDEERVGERSHPGQQVIYVNHRAQEEEAAARLIERFRNRKHEHHTAWKEAQKPPSQRSWLNKLTSLTRAKRVTEFLDFLQRRNTVVLETLNHEAIAWWRKAAVTANLVSAVLSVLFIVLVVGVGITANVMEEKRPAERIRPLPSNGWPSMPSSGFGPSAQGGKAPTKISEPIKRFRARAACAYAVRALKRVPDGVRTFVTSEAEERCKVVLKMTPDSLLMRQYAGIAALRIGDANAAREHFEAILKASPDDAYALFGRGFAVGNGSRIDVSGAKDMSDALAIEPEVASYFAEFGVLAPDVKPSARKPASRLPKVEPIAADTKGEQIANPKRRDGQALADHFGLDHKTAGTVVLDCIVNAAGRATNCHIRSETPANVGLGEVGLLVMEDVRYNPPKLNGEPVGGMPLRYTLEYNLPGKGGETPKAQPTSSPTPSPTPDDADAPAEGDGSDVHEGPTGADNAGR